MQPLEELRAVGDVAGIAVEVEEVLAGLVSADVPAMELGSILRREAAVLESERVVGWVPFAMRVFEREVDDPILEHRISPLEVYWPSRSGASRVCLQTITRE